MAQEGERFNTERGANAAADAREAADRAKWDAARVAERAAAAAAEAREAATKAERAAEAALTTDAERAAAAAAEAREAADRAAELAAEADAGEPGSPSY
jgi:hypothetical protein